MNYALSTVGQGDNAFVAFTACSINSNNTGAQLSGIEFDMLPVSGNSAGFYNIGGTSSTNVTSFRAEIATGKLQWRHSSSVLLESAVGVFVLNERHKYGAEWDEVNFHLYLTKNGSRVAGPFTATAIQTNWTINQHGKVGSTAPGGHSGELYGIRTYGDVATYVDGWDATTAVSTGTSWNSTSGTRALTIVGATGAADTWWKPYGGSTIVDTTFAVTAAASISLQTQKLQSSPIAIAVSASIALTAAKLSPATMAIASSVFFGLSYRKQGAQKVAVPGSGAVVLAANKGGVSTLSIPVAVEVGLYSGPVSNVSGTFTVSASAAFSFQSSKAAASTTQFAAAAALAIASNKSGRSNAVVTAAVNVAATAAKSSQSTLSIAITANITINGQNLSEGEPEQWPVDVVFVSTNSRYQHVIASGSRFEYHITTHSRGGTSV